MRPLQLRKSHLILRHEYGACVDDVRSVVFRLFLFSEDLRVGIGLPLPELGYLDLNDEVSLQNQNGKVLPSVVLLIKLYIL